MTFVNLGNEFKALPPYQNDLLKESLLTATGVYKSFRNDNRFSFAVIASLGTRFLVVKKEKIQIMTSEKKYSAFAYTLSGSEDKFLKTQVTWKRVKGTPEEVAELRKYLEFQRMLSLPYTGRPVIIRHKTKDDGTILEWFDLNFIGTFKSNEAKFKATLSDVTPTLVKLHKLGLCLTHLTPKNIISSKDHSMIDEFRKLTSYFVIDQKAPENDPIKSSIYNKYGLVTPFCPVYSYTISLGLILWGEQLANILDVRDWILVNFSLEKLPAFVNRKDSLQLRFWNILYKVVQSDVLISNRAAKGLDNPKEFWKDLKDAIPYADISSLANGLEDLCN
jgi:hypothetical protein